MSGEFPAQAMERIPLSWANFLLAHHCWNDIVVQNLNVLSRIHHLLPRQNDQIMRLTAKRSPHCNTYKISNKISIKILMIYQLKWKDWLLIDKGSHQKKMRILRHWSKRWVGFEKCGKFRTFFFLKPSLNIHLKATFFSTFHQISVEPEPSLTVSRESKLEMEPFLK